MSSHAHDILGLHFVGRDPDRNFEALPGLNTLALNDERNPVEPTENANLIFPVGDRGFEFHTLRRDEEPFILGLGFVHLFSSLVRVASSKVAAWAGRVSDDFVLPTTVFGLSDTPKQSVPVAPTPGEAA